MSFQNIVDGLQIIVPIIVFIMLAIKYAPMMHKE